MNANDRKYVESNREQLEYLFDLRESGRTNMFGAANFLVSEMGMDKVEAREVLGFWMKNFDEIAKELGVEV